MKSKIKGLQVASQLERGGIYLIEKKLFRHCARFTEIFQLDSTAEETTDDERLELNTSNQNQSVSDNSSIRFRPKRNVSNQIDI